MLASQENGLIFFLTQQQVWQVKATQSCLTNFQVRRLWGSLSLLQGIFPTQGSNPGILHCRQISYQLSRKGSPRILEWVAYPFSRGSSWPRNRTGVSFIAGGFFTNNTGEDSTHGHHQMVHTEIRLIIFFAAKDGEALYSQQKQDQELTVAQIMNSLLPNSDLNGRK